MKIIEKSYEQRNLIFFILASMFFLQSVASLSKGQSVLTPEMIVSLFENNLLIWALNIVTIYMVFFLKKHSEKFVFLCFFVIGVKNFILLASSFNKLILGLSFIYLLFAFYFYVSWELFVGKALYRPNFSKHDLEKETRLKMKAKLVIKNGEEVEEFESFVTNIDKESAFILLDEQSIGEALAKLKAKSQFKLISEIDGVSFSQPVKVITHYDRGIGVQFMRSTEVADYNWQVLYKICLERGYFV